MKNWFAANRRLFGLLAVEMAVGLMAQGRSTLTWTLAAIFLVLNLLFVYRSFYCMRIEETNGLELPAETAAAEGSAR